MKRIATIVMASLLVIAAIALACYWTGWNVAKSAATEVALGKSRPPTLPPGPEYYERLKRPTRPYVVVRTAVEDMFIQAPNDFQANFYVANSQDDGIPLVQLSVMVRLGLTGWKVVGYGSGG